VNNVGSRVDELVLGLRAWLCLIPAVSNTNVIKTELEVQKCLPVKPVTCYICPSLKLICNRNSACFYQTIRTIYIYIVQVLFYNNINIGPRIHIMTLIIELDSFHGSASPSVPERHHCRDFITTPRHATLGRTPLNE
jgi:hypothetical protein